MSTTAVMHFHSFVQTPIFPSPLRALVSRPYQNKHHHHHLRSILGDLFRQKDDSVAGARRRRFREQWRHLERDPHRSDTVIPPDRITSSVHRASSLDSIWSCRARANLRLLPKQAKNGKSMNQTSPDPGFPLIIRCCVNGDVSCHVTASLQLEEIAALMPTC